MGPSKLFIQDRLGLNLPVYDMDFDFKPRVLSQDKEIVLAASRLVPLISSTNLGDTEDNIVLRMLFEATEPRDAAGLSDAFHLASNTFSDRDLAPCTTLSLKPLKIDGVESYTHSSLSPETLFIAAGPEYLGYIVHKDNNIGFLLHNSYAVLQFKILKN